MNERICECCGMPMGDTDELYGTEADRSKSRDYCKYCFECGEFTSICTMDEMIEACVPHMVEANPDISADEARNIMKAYLPKLKRWQGQ